MAQGGASPSFGARFGDVTPRGPVLPLQAPPLPSSRSDASPGVSCSRQASGERGCPRLQAPSTALALPAPLPPSGFGMPQFSPSLGDREGGGHPRLASPRRCQSPSRPTEERDHSQVFLGAGLALLWHPHVLAAPAVPWLRVGGRRGAVSPRVTGIPLGFAPWQNLLAQSPHRGSTAAPSPEPTSSSEETLLAHPAPAPPNRCPPELAPSSFPGSTATRSTCCPRPRSL